MLRGIFNFRAFLIVGLCVTVEVFCVYLYAYNAVAGLVTGVICILACGGLGGLFIFRFLRNRARLRVAVSFLIATALCACAFAMGVVQADRWERGKEVEGYCSVSGRVCDIDTQTGNYRLFLDDLLINGKAEVGVMRVNVSVSENNIADTVRHGDTLRFNTKIQAVYLAENGGKINGNAYRTDVRYTAGVRSDGIVQIFGQPTLLERFTSATKEQLTANMGEKYGNIAFAMLTGDKHGINYGVSSYYSAAGIGHIMAVSGLHIGFLVLLLNFVLCKIRKKVRFPIIGGVLVLYAVLADFSPSVVRAVIMAFISGIGIIIGGRRDLLSSLFCAYSLILAFRPFYLFEVGFLLSFGALFGIAVFAGTIRRFEERHGAHKKISNAVAGSLSANIGIIPAQAYFFGNINFLAVLVNIFVLPYVSVVFISIICLLPVSAIPHCASALYFCKYLLMPLDYAAYGISKINLALVCSNTICAVFLCYPVMFIAGEHTMLGKSKTAVSWYSLAVCAGIIAVCAL